MFILVYDENDGLFDHVPPPVPPAGTPDEFPANFAERVDPNGWPIGAGFRVPCVVVSPWTVGGWVCSEPFDHTSNLRLLELVTGVNAPNVSAWRRQTFGDFTSAFRFGEARSDPPTLRGTHEAAALARREGEPLPPPHAPVATQTLPAQEQGARPAVPPRTN